MGALAAVINKKGEDAKEEAVAMLETLEGKGTEAFGIASSNEMKIEKSLDALLKIDISSPIVIGHVFSKVLATDKPQPIDSGNAMLVFEGRFYPIVNGVSDAETVAEKLRQNRENAVKNLIGESKGNFAFVVAEPKRLIAGRDAVGMYPLYYGENDDTVALATERKALWKIGIEKTDSFPPGQMAVIDNEGFKFTPVKTLAKPRTKQLGIQDAAKKLQALLVLSIKDRVSGLKEVAVAFSGGLDSSIVAFLAKRSGVNVHLFHVSLENQPETETAKQAAEELALPIHIFQYREDEVKKVLPSVIRLIEESNPVKVSIGIPVYWAAETVAKAGFRVMFAGQGADELFGGYKRYLDDYSRYGKQRVQEKIFQDISGLYENNLERDFKICNFHNVELRLPFATYEMAEFTKDLPLQLKIGSASDQLRKLVLRHVAKNLGLPQFIVKKPKRAIQYTTGITKALRKNAKKEGSSLKEYVQNLFRATFEKIV
jgi:asparagine synthase (glutamine-hydrolysing)